jgi:hypothetical protein
VIHFSLCNFVNNFKNWLSPSKSKKYLASGSLINPSCQQILCLLHSIIMHQLISILRWNYFPGKTGFLGHGMGCKFLQNINFLQFFLSKLVFLNLKKQFHEMINHSFYTMFRPFQRHLIYWLKGIVSWNKNMFWRFYCIAGNFLNSRQRI